MSAIIFDTETTGMKEPEIVEAAWVQVASPKNLQHLQQFSRLYKPSKPIECGAMATHHIRALDVERCSPSSTFKLPAFANYIIGHNIDYDWGVVGSPPVKRICTLALSRFLWPSADSFSLGAMLYHVHESAARQILKNAHSAMADVKATAYLLQFIIEALPHIETWEDLWGHSEAARLPTIMTFGKWKGTPLKDVPYDYVSWLLKQPDLEPYLERALQAL